MTPRALTLPVLLALAGCAVTPPYTVEIADQAAYTRDLSACQAYAAAYRPSLSTGALATDTASGALGNTAEAVINPYVPLAGAAGGAGLAITDWLGLTATKRQSILCTCLTTKSRIMPAPYLVLEPCV